MQTISILSDLVIDQIAAGEVLEHPASAVKEMVENSLDAGAGEIRIEIEAGGLQKIFIDDDGCGMGEADARLCLKRHATSKLRASVDLQSLRTMGFRGEALAAISSVSALELRTSNGQEATRLRIEGGSSPLVERCARNRGTDIEVRSLFYNTPARLKFQKSPSACAAAVLRTVQSLSLAHPGVSFRLLSNGKPVFEVKASDWKQRVQEVLGPLEHEIAWTEKNIVIKGFAGRPEEAKGNRSGQYVYVNGRPITSLFISRAAKEGFGTRIAESLYPAFILFLEIDPDKIDVNVHPQKREIRFRDEGMIYLAVRTAVANAFAATEKPIAPLPWEFTPVPAVPFVFEEAPSPVAEASLPVVIHGREIALVGDYLLVEKEGWKWVDVRGAEARVLFETMEKQQPQVQPLMWPVEIDLGQGGESEETAILLKEAGIEARAMDRRRLAVDALPIGMEASYLEEFIKQYKVGRSERSLAASITRVCRASNRRYSMEEATMIWRSLQACKDRAYDPLGKRIVAPMSEEQLAEFFQ